MNTKLVTCIDYWHYLEHKPFKYKCRAINLLREGLANQNQGLWDEETCEEIRALIHLVELSMGIFLN